MMRMRGAENGAVDHEQRDRRGRAELGLPQVGLEVPARVGVSTCSRRYYTSMPLNTQAVPAHPAPMAGQAARLAVSPVRLNAHDPPPLVAPRQPRPTWL